MCTDDTQTLGFPLFARPAAPLGICTHWLSNAFIYPTHTAHTASGFFFLFFPTVYILIDYTYQDFYID